MSFWIGPIPQNWWDKTITDKKYRRMLFDRAKGKCQRCGRKLDFDKAGTKHRGDPGCWEIHHHPERSLIQKRLKGTINPHWSLFVQVLCIDCHDSTRGKIENPLQCKIVPFQ